jgi:aldo/keto reductase family protein
VRRLHLTRRIPKNGSGKRENETAGLSGELLIGDDFLVARLGLRTMRLTGKGTWGEPADRGEAIRVVRRAVELGVNFIDTPDWYGPNVSEGIIAEALIPIPKASSSRPSVASSGPVLTNGLKTEGRNI